MPGLHTTIQAEDQLAGKHLYRTEHHVGGEAGSLTLDSSEKRRQGEILLLSYNYVI